MLVGAGEPHTFPMPFIQRSSVLLKPVSNENIPASLAASPRSFFIFFDETKASIKFLPTYDRPRYTLQVFRPQVLSQ